jgi:hypothetical protein
MIFIELPSPLRRGDLLSMNDYYLAPLAPEERRGEGQGVRGSSFHLSHE